MFRVAAIALVATAAFDYFYLDGRNLHALSGCSDPFNGGATHSAARFAG